MKVFTIARTAVVCGLALGAMAVWSNAAPSTVDGAALRGAGWSFCKCYATGRDCEIYDDDCGGHVNRCVSSTESDNMCRESETQNTCSGKDCYLVGGYHEECYTE